MLTIQPDEVPSETAPLIGDEFVPPSPTKLSDFIRLDGKNVFVELDNRTTFVGKLLITRANRFYIGTSPVISMDRINYYREV